MIMGLPFVVNRKDEPALIKNLQHDIQGRDLRGYGVSDPHKLENFAVSQSKNSSKMYFSWAIY